MERKARNDLGCQNIRGRDEDRGSCCVPLLVVLCFYRRLALGRATWEIRTRVPNIDRKEKSFTRLGLSRQTATVIK